eukprot:TRINITY_DN275_c0_g1_i1.p1 TRINITY_DN275_c0_g1~~TRINITY_DN275_c0_g1_i1.p1  ORF type:complete len:569 (+),score=137.82 TRINITY_DN275_c0_g1_i1:64-1770(+)
MSLCYCIPWCTFLNDQEQKYLKSPVGRSVKNGPGCFCIGPCNEGETREGITVREDQYVKIKDNLSGRVRVQDGPAFFFQGAFDDNPNVKSCYALDRTQYLIVRNSNSGERWMMKGPQRWIPGPYDIVEREDAALTLTINDYVKIRDTETGVIRVERGESMVFIGAYEEIIFPINRPHKNGIVEAINVDEHTSVLVRDISTAELFLVTKEQLFVPNPYQEIEGIQKKIVLEAHETMIIRDKDGKYHFMSGAGNTKPSKELLKRKGYGKDSDFIKTLYKEGGKSFFVPPYCEILKLVWTTQGFGNSKEKVTRIDSRPHFMEYTFVCRTSDNVELIIDVTFFWQILNVQDMIKMTDDAPGDICAHARSIVIQAVSKLPMEEFMSDFNQILAHALLEQEDPFYEERGVVIHTVEVKSFHCKDDGTENVLQEIIKERTDRLNRLQKQESDNEVKIYKMKGDIEEEKLNGELLKIRHSHHRTEAAMEGEAEADQISMFMNGIPENVDEETKFSFWGTLRKIDAIRSIGNSGSHLYYTPNDVELSIGTFETPWNQKKPKKRAAKKYDYNKFTNDT